jgi:hypothetical protein
MATSPRTTIQAHLGAKAEALLEFHSPKIAKERLHLPGPDFIDRVWSGSDRNIRVLTNLQRLYEHGRLGKTGYLSILPVDQGIEHSAGASFAKNPDQQTGGWHRADLRAESLSTATSGRDSVTECRSGRLFESRSNRRLRI